MFGFRLLGNRSSAPDMTPHHVERWYDRQTRCWIVQLMSVDDFQICDAVYVHSKREAVNETARLHADHNLPMPQRTKP